MAEGRPTKLTPQVTRKIVKDIVAGNTFETAATRAGISYGTFALWMRKGRRRNPDKKHVKFFKAIKKAEADAIARNVAIIKRASIKTWTAAAWWLERRHYKDFGQKQTNENVGTARLVVVEEVVRAPVPDQAEGAVTPGANGVHRG